jgi:outer membrane receptor for monomeric catechols
LLTSWAILFCGLAVEIAPAIAQISTENPSDQEVVKLDPFQVVVPANKGYQVSSATAATRTNTPLIDIPQTVDIVNSQMWSDFGSTTWDQSFKYVANAFVRNRNAGGGDGINVRGLQMPTSNSFAVDGVLVGDQRYKRDLVGYDRLEIVKGPPSAVQGRAGGTGYFNYILKKPVLDQDFQTIKLITGIDEFSAKFNRVEVNTNTLLNSTHTMAFRLAAAWQQSDDYIKFQKFSQLSLYPSFRWKIDSKTEVVWTNEILKDLTPSREEGHGFGDYSYKLRVLLPQFNVPNDPITSLHLPYNFSAAGPGENAYEKVVSSALFVTRAFTDHIAYRQVINWRSNSFDSQAFTVENNSVSVIKSAYQHSITEYRNVTVQGDLIANYRWKWVDGSTMVGYNYRDEFTTNVVWSGTPNAPFNFIDLAALAATGDSLSYFSGRTVNDAPPATSTRAKAMNLGVYAEQSVGFFHDQLLLNGSLRRDHDYLYTLNMLKSPPVQSTGGNIWLTSYRFGFTAKVRPHLALYAVESLQNNPASTYQKYGQLLPGDPRLAEYFTVSPSVKLYEYGIKGEALNGRLSFTANHWQMNSTGTVVPTRIEGVSMGQPVSISVFSLLQGAGSHGFEVTSLGEVTDRFSVIANYTRMWTGQQNTATPDQPGNRIALNFAPIWDVNFFGKYNIPVGKQQSLDLKAGASFIGPFWGQFTLSTGGTVIYVPHSQKSIDVGMGYHYRRYHFDLMVTNVFNDVFLITRDQPPRTYRFSVLMQF